MKARRTAVVIGALVVAALTGCSLGPGEVARVEGHTITEAQLDGVLDELGPLLANSSRVAVLGALVQSEALLMLGEVYDVEVTDEEAGEFLDDLSVKVGAEPREWGPGALAIAKAEQVGQTVFASPDAEEAQMTFEFIRSELDVTVSPRYGEYDPASGGIAQVQPDWIVVPGAGEPVG